MVGQQQVGTCHVAYSYQGEAVVIGFSGSRVDAGGTGRAVAGADDVCADGKPPLRVEKFALFDGVGPPVSHLGVGGQGVANPQNVITCIGAVGVVCDTERNLHSTFETKRFVRRKILGIGGNWNGLFGHSNLNVYKAAVLLARYRGGRQLHLHSGSILSAFLLRVCLLISQGVFYCTYLTDRWQMFLLFTSSGDRERE